MTTTTMSVTEADVLEMSERTMALSVTTSLFGNHRNVPRAHVTLTPAEKATERSAKAADKDLTTVTKTLLDFPELTQIQKHDSRTASYLRKVGFSSGMAGIHLVPTSEVMDVTEYLRTRKAEREVLVDAAVSMYRQRLAETKERLGWLYKASDYPTVEVFRSKFGFSWKWVMLSTPTTLSEISEEMFTEERDKLRQARIEAAEEARLMLRAGVLRLVEHLKEKLTPSADGKTKRLHATTVENLMDFLSRFDRMNVTRDQMLSDVVAQARGMLDGLDVVTLRSDELVRRKVVEDLSQIGAALQPLVPVGRKITFDDDDVVAA